jgi:hypothetical protein
MKDWKYDELRRDLARVEKKVHKVEDWQVFFPLRVMMVVCVLAALGTWVAVIVHGLQN